MSAMKIFILGLIPVLEECCWIIPREVVNRALGLSDLLKKKKKEDKYFGSYMFKYCDCTKFSETGYSLKGGSVLGS